MEYPDLPDIEGDKPAKKFKSYPIGYFHIDIAEVQKHTSISGTSISGANTLAAPVATLHGKDEALWVIPSS